ncbi:ABC transporter permease/substrate-binding protein [Fulvivirgaceae bacterium BMA10]|uniref:ABC transporter permease/substrate-binding protein n=1 Tax=Splendidivirga corallicola TaxID=3051826 RepID=A0ABT8KXV9_9BACT|nr:ABC transporter permease/substrate-binding protein [Fulvivirgaceae bacterium BMA10]
MIDSLRGVIAFMIDNQEEIWKQTLEHLWITVVALGVAVIVGLLLGVIISRYERLAGPVIGTVGIFQIIPSIALLGFMIPFLGIGVVPAIVALFLYGLLPIVRNTFTGINSVKPSIKEAARGMGMSNTQILTRVELPLAMPVIFAGIRTAFVINVGVATLCALIAAGGLGEFIFRGIALNNVNMIFAGAIPAAILAIFFDALLGTIQKYIKQLIKPVLITVILGIFIIVPYFFVQSMAERSFRGGFPSEFMQRADGYEGLEKLYNLDMETVELEIGLMYQAVKNKDVDVISGFSTDGRIKAYNLRNLIDDKHYFPPYYAAPMVRGATLRKYPELNEVFERIAGKISDEQMAKMNYEVDQNKKAPKAVAKAYLNEIGLKTDVQLDGDPVIVVGSKNFTENFILAEMFAYLIENYANLKVELKLGFGGTKLNIDALANGDIDLYPEYTGTGLLVLINPREEIRKSIIDDKDKVYDFVKEESRKQYDFEWLQPLGFNNTFALMMREEHARQLNIQSISDLSKYLENL